MFPSRHHSVCCLCTPLLSVLRAQLDDLALIDEQTYSSLMYMLQHPIKDVFFESFAVDSETYGIPSLVCWPSP